MSKISAVYQIVNTVTGENYVGSSKDVKRRWIQHKCPSVWKKKTNPMYQDMQKYGVDKFRFQILAPVMPEYLKQVEQEFIEMLRPTYNNYRAKGFDDKEYSKGYRQTNKYRESQKEYRQSDKYRETNRKYLKKYRHQLCEYNGETLTLNALSGRFRSAGIEHPILEAKKYLLVQ